MYIHIRKGEKTKCKVGGEINLSAKRTSKVYYIVYLKSHVGGESKGEVR